jgi:succinoglycan biosynthesis protein ExoA
VSEPIATPFESRQLVSVVVPMRNEASTIEACLASLLGSRLPEGIDLEILVLDGGSSDASPVMVAALGERDPRVRLLDNPDRLQAAAINRALDHARGDVLLRADAHSLYAEDYVAECVRLLEETGAANVGGVQRAAGTSWLGRAIAAAVSSRFAAGDAKYRHASEPSWTDTVYLGAWRIATLRELGGMRADWAVNEDYELNVRLRAAGGRIYLSPTIRSTYFVRDSLARLLRQYARYGFWKVRTLLEHPGSLRWRQLVAPLFVLSLLATPLTVHFFGMIGAVHVAAYLLADITASVVVAARNGWSLLPALPMIFAVVHCAWGGGFLAGLVYWPFRHR